MRQYLGRQTGQTSEGNRWQRDATDEGRKVDERYSGAQNVELEVEVEGHGSLGGYRRNEKRRNEERRNEERRNEERTREEGRSEEIRHTIYEYRRLDDLWGFQTAERRPERRSFQEQGHKDYEVKTAQATPFPMYRPRSTEGMSFRDSAYQTSTTDRPAVPEDILEEAEGILNETKYETPPATTKSTRKKKTVTKEAVSPSPSQRKAKKERRQLNFKEINGTSDSEYDERNLRSSSTKKKTPKKTVKKLVEKKETKSLEVVSTTDTSSDENKSDSSGRNAKYVVKLPK